MLYTLSVRYVFSNSMFLSYAESLGPRGVQTVGPATEKDQWQNVLSLWPDTAR